MQISTVSRHCPGRGGSETVNAPYFFSNSGLSRWQKCSAEGGGAKEAAPANIAVNYYAAKFRNSNYLEGKTPVAGLEVMVY